MEKVLGQYSKEKAYEFRDLLRNEGIEDCYVSATGHLVINRVREGFNKGTTHYPIVVENGEYIVVRDTETGKVADILGHVYISKMNYIVCDNGTMKKTYFPNGICNYIYTNSLSQTFWDNGKPKYRTEFKDGKRNGLHQSFNRKGILIAEINYTNGVMDGVNTQYYDTGKLRVQRIYENGKAVSVKYAKIS